MRWILLLTLLAGLLLSTTNHAMAATGTITGTVVDSEGKIVVNHKVHFRKVVTRGPVGRTNLAADSLNVGTATTDKEGKFSHALEAGSYWVEAGSKTLGFAKQRVEVKAGETTDIKLALAKEDAAK